MITVKVSDLLLMAQDLNNDGYEYVEINELEADNETSKCLFFEALDGFGGCVVFDGIDHIDVSYDYKSELD